MAGGTHPLSAPPQTAAEAAREGGEATETQGPKGPQRVQGFGKRRTAGERIAEEMLAPR